MKNVFFFIELAELIATELMIDFLKTCLTLIGRESARILTLAASSRCLIPDHRSQPALPFIWKLCDKRCNKMIRLNTFSTRHSFKMTHPAFCRISCKVRNLTFPSPIRQFRDHTFRTVCTSNYNHIGSERYHSTLKLL